MILNVLRRKISTHLDELDETEESFSEYLLNHFVVKLLYGDSADNGISSSLSVELRGFDNRYFRLLFEDSDRRLLRIIDDMDKGTPGELIKVSTLLERIGRDPDNISDRDLERFDDGFLNQKVYFASQGSHAKLLDAHEYYSQVIDEFLQTDLGLSDDDHLGRVFAMINIALVLMRSFRVIRSRLSTRVSSETKVQFFQSLNETGESLSISDKIRARVVAEFGFDEPEIEAWESVTTDFGDNSDKIEDYLIDYLISDISRSHVPELQKEAEEDEEERADEEDEERADESDDETGEKDGGIDKIKKSDISNHLLDAFAISKRPRPSLESRLVGDGVDTDSFFSSLETSSPRYNEIKRASLSREHFDEQNNFERANEYLERLRGKQWRPLVLLLYNELADTDSSVNDQVMVKMLDVVENLLLRFALTGERADTIEPSFTTPCLYYNEREVPSPTQDRLDIEDSEFNVLDTDLLSELILESTAMEDMSQNSLTNALMFNNSWKRLRDLLVRIAQENMRNSSGEEARRATGHHEWLKGEELEMEHILPSTPKLDEEVASEPLSWLYNFVQYSPEETESDDEEEADVESVDMPSWLTEGDIEAIRDDDRDAERILERIRTLFIDDPGNRMLLHRTVNNRIKNKPFSVKIVFYYLTSYNDLKSMGEYLANLDNLDTSPQELVELIDSLAEAAELTEEEANVLFYRASNTFSLNKDQVEESLSYFSLNDWERTSRDRVEEYDDAQELFDDLNINQSDHAKLYDDDWPEFTITTLDGSVAFVRSESESETVRSYDGFMTEVIEAILLKIGRVDVTDSDEMDDLVIDFNSKWNWERMVDRKAHLVEQALSTLSFETREFDRENTSKEDAYDQIYSQTDRAY